MSVPVPAYVRMLAFLHDYRRDRGQETAVFIDVPESGVTAAELAHSLDLPLERIEGLFLNGHLVGLGALVRPGDRAAFVPHGTPATHPAFFGRRGVEEHASV